MTHTGLCPQNTSFIVGIIIAVICSNWVGEAIHSDGIYETDLEADGSVIFLRPSPPPGLNTKKAIRHRLQGRLVPALQLPLTVVAARHILQYSMKIVVCVLVHGMKL